MKTKYGHILAPLSLLVLFCASCASMPKQPAPEASLKYVSSDTTDPRHVTLNFTVDTKNPREDPATIHIDSWTPSVAGADFDKDKAVFTVDSLLDGGEPQARLLAPGESRSFATSLTLDLSDWLEANPPEEGATTDITLRLEMIFEYPLAAKVSTSMRHSRAVFLVQNAPEPEQAAEE